MTGTERPATLRLVLSSAAVLLAMAHPSTVGLDRSGTGSITDLTHLSQLCSNVTVVKAWKDGSDRAYVIQASCDRHPDFPPFSVTVEAAFVWFGQWGNAYESIEVAGPVQGKVMTSVEKCDKDPFVSPGIYSCTGEKRANYNLTTKIVLWWKERPLFGGSVPANQVSQALSSPTGGKEPGVVRIVSPTENQLISLGTPSFQVRFEDNPTFKPDPNGAVRLEWERFDGRKGWVKHPGPPTYVEYYRMAQMVSVKQHFTRGKYRVRALAAPQNTWTWWRGFSIYSPVALQVTTAAWKQARPMRVLRKEEAPVRKLPR